MTGLDHVLRRLLAAGLLLALGLATPAGAAERRCDELGAHCICSEPFASAQRSVDDFRQNPGDSSAKECSGGNALTNATPRPVPAAGLGLPAAATVSHVWEDHGVHGGAVEGNTPERPGSERICVRYYVRYSHDYDFFGDGGCRAGKLTQIDLGSKISSSPLHAEAKSDQWRIITQGLGGSTMRASGAPRPADCRGNWCRVEMCISGDIARGRDLYFDGYAQSLTTGQRSLWRRELRGSTSDGGGVHNNGMWLMNLYREGSCSGKRWFSHVMQAEWSDFDPLQHGPYIGAAYEIEGVGGDDGGAALAPPAPDPGPTPDPDPPPPDTSPGAVAGTGATCGSEPDGIFCETFESGSLAAFQDQRLGDILTTQTDPVAVGGRALAANIPSEDNAGGAWLGRFFGDHPELGSSAGGAEQDVYLSARLRFSENFEFAGGKIFTLAAFESWSAGYPEPMSWSPYYLILQYKENGEPEGILHSKTSGGSVWRALRQNLGFTVLFEGGRWYELQYHMRLNTAGRDDGIFEMWIDGDLVLRYANVNFRDSHPRGWNHLMVTPYLNQGGAPAPESIHWDELILSRLPQGGPPPPASPGDPDRLSVP